MKESGMAILRKLTCAAMLTTLALTLGGCETFDSVTDMFDTKKKLPGDRKPVFPEGVPGVSQGIPAELQKGYNEQAAQPGPDPATAAVQQLSQPEKEKPKPKPVAKPVAKPKPAPRPVQQVQSPPPPQQPSQPQGGDMPVRQAPLPWPGQ
jgi:outer membrane biosynthesis protein TonB